MHHFYERITLRASLSPRMKQTGEMLAIVQFSSTKIVDGTTDPGLQVRQSNVISGHVDNLLQQIRPQPQWSFTQFGTAVFKR
jgi:hypothetical protein